MKASINKKTGLIIESCSSSTDQTMIENALAMGYEESDIEIRQVDDVEHSALIVKRDYETKSFADKQAIKQIEITDGFLSVIKQGFTGTYGIKMDSTMPDLQTLKLAYDFAILMNEPAMTIVDFDNVAHVAVLLPDVLTMIMEIGANYRDLFLRKQTLRGQAMAAQNISELDLITWS